MSRLLAIAYLFLLVALIWVGGFVVGMGLYKPKYTEQEQAVLTAMKKDGYFVAVISHDKSLHDDSGSVKISKNNNGQWNDLVILRYDSMVECLADQIFILKALHINVEGAKSNDN